MNDTLWLFLCGPWEWMTAESVEGTQCFLFIFHNIFGNTVVISFHDNVEEIVSVTMEMHNNI